MFCHSFVVENIQVPGGYQQMKADHSYVAVIRRGASAIALATVVALTAAPAGAISVGGLWLFDEGSGQVVKDRSGNANTGTLGSTPAADANDPVWIPGAWRKTSALRFGGDDFVAVADSPSLESARITVGAVVRATGSPGAYRYVASKGALACEVASYGLYTGVGGGLVFYVSDGTRYTTSPDAGQVLWDGRWHLVYGTFDGAMVRLFVDGAQVGAGSASTVTIRYGMPDTDTFFVGGYGGPCPTPLGFVGDVDAAGVLQDVVNWRPASS